ncbi:MAG: ComEA family DNA-binding protein [Jatrophihabitans sp.]
MLRVNAGEPRGESARVAQRVRELLQAHDGDEFDEPLPGSMGAGDMPPIAPAPLGRRLAARIPLHVDPGRRSVFALGVAVVLAAALTGLWLRSSRPDPIPVSAAVPAMSGQPVRTGPTMPASSGPVSAAPTLTPTVIVVDVAGRVHRPGVYRLPSGARVDDALKAAGGALRGVDVSTLNLAALLVDGQQVAVGRPGATGGPSPPAAASSPAGAGSGGSPGSGAPVNLNAATLDQLETLPGIGPALGQRILDYRTEHGSFATVDQLDDVSGIGTVTFKRLKPLVTV